MDNWDFPYTGGKLRISFVEFYSKGIYGSRSKINVGRKRVGETKQDQT